MEIEAIIFDNDGVLIDTEGTAVIHDLPFLKQYGISYTVPEYAELMSGKSLKEFLQILNGDCLKQTGSQLPLDFLDKLRELHAWQVDNIVTEVPGATALVLEEKALGTKIAIASNGEKASLKHKMERINLYNIFMPHVYNKDDVGGHGKPEPDMLFHAATQLGVDPAKCVYVGDSKLDMEAGAAGGIYTIGYSGGAHRNAQYGQFLEAHGASIVFNAMADIGKHIKWLRSQPSPTITPTNVAPAP